MNLRQFQGLEESNQCIELYNFGELVSRRIIGHQLLGLYMLHAFYVEVSYTPEMNSFTQLYAFENTDELEPYLLPFQFLDIFTNRS